MYLFAVTYDPKDLWIVALATIAVAALAYLLLRLDTKLERIQEAMLDLSRTCVEEGFERLAVVAEKLAMKDLDKAYDEMKRLAKDLLNEEKRIEIFGKLFYRQLAKRLERPEDKERIRKALAAVDNPPATAAPEPAPPATPPVAK